VVILASLGGLRAVSTVLAGLPEAFDVPLVVLQHSRAGAAAQALPALLGRRCLLPLRAAASGDLLGTPGVAVIPAGHTGTLDAAGRLSLALAGPRGGGDELLASAAAGFGPRLIGVVLTGLLRDGAHGVRAIKRHGGRVLVQDPTTARAASMPSAAIATGCVDFVLPPDRIAPALVALTMAPGAAEMLAVPTPHWAAL
jgi:two-component system chemotaxis response regulator CheB